MQSQLINILKKSTYPLTSTYDAQCTLLKKVKYARLIPNQLQPLMCVTTREQKYSELYVAFIAGNNKLVI